MDWGANKGSPIHKEFYLGDSSSHDVEGRGTVMIILDSGEARTIENVLHIPATKKSLISFDRVTDASYQRTHAL